MSMIINKARRGSSEAMLELYEQNKSLILHLCSVLLASDNAAEIVSAKAFKLAFEQTAQGFYASEEEFCGGVVKKAVNLCKSQVGKKNSKAFNIPTSKNFAANSYDACKMNFSGDIQKIIIKNLPPLHRFIYVLHTLCGYSEEEIGELFHMAEATVESALGSIESNVAKIVTITSSKMKMNISMNEEKLREWLLSSADSTDLRRSVDDTVLITIENICTPIREKGKKQRMKNTYIFIAILLAVLLFIGVLIAGSGGDNDTDGSDIINTDSTSDEDTSDEDTSDEDTSDEDTSDEDTSDEDTSDEDTSDEDTSDEDTSDEDTSDEDTSSQDDTSSEEE